MVKKTTKRQKAKSKAKRSKNETLKFLRFVNELGESEE